MFMLEIAVHKKIDLKSKSRYVKQRCSMVEEWYKTKELDQ